MASLRKIRREQIEIIPSDKNGDEVEYGIVMKLVPFDPPICTVCNQEMKNINTVEGKMRFQCMTWGCTNHRLYDIEGN